jgi:DNA-3-methyladenine glycosylase
MILDDTFFNKDALLVAEQLLGKAIHHKYDNILLSAQIIEIEAYFINEKGSHASLGYSESRKALFMPPGTIYMYYARGGDSLNFSCKGDGNAVLIKSGIPFLNNYDSDKMIKMMQKLNPIGNRVRKPMHLCSGQTLLCKSLGLKVTNWNRQTLQKGKLYLEDVGINPSKIVVAKRLGIPKGRDEQLMYRFIDFDNIKYCTKNPLSVRTNIEGKDYIIKSA